MSITHDFSFSDGNVEVWGLFDFREDTESPCVAPSPLIELYVEAVPIFMPLKVWGHGCGYRRNPIIYVAWTRHSAGSADQSALLPRELRQVADEVKKELRGELNALGEAHAGDAIKIDMFDLVPATKSFTNLGNLSGEDFECGEAVYPLAGSLLAAAVDGVPLVEKKKICVGNWDFFYKRPIFAQFDKYDIKDKINAARKTGITEMWYSCPPRDLEGIDGGEVAIHRLASKDTLMEAVEPYRISFRSK